MQVFITLKKVALLCTTGILISSVGGFLWSWDPMLVRLYNHQTAAPVRDLEEAGAITLHEDVISEITQEETEAGYESWIYVGKKVAEDTYLEGQDISDNAISHFKINGLLAAFVWCVLFWDLTQKPGASTEPSSAPSG